MIKNDTEALDWIPLPGKTHTPIPSHSTPKGNIDLVEEYTRIYIFIHHLT